MQPALEEAPVCTFCLPDVEEGWKTPCGLFFHGECLDPWLSQNSHLPRCPNCNSICWPGAIDRSFVLVLFVGFNPAPAADDIALNDEEDAVLDVAWVPNNPDLMNVEVVPDSPVAVGNNVEPIPNAAVAGADSEVVWVADYPAPLLVEQQGAVVHLHGSHNDSVNQEVVWVADIPAAYDAFGDEVVWVADIPAQGALNGVADELQQ